MARPVRPPEDLRTEVARTNLTVEEKQLVEELAANQGCTVPQLIRYWIHKEGADLWRKKLLYHGYVADTLGQSQAA